MYLTLSNSKCNKWPSATRTVSLMIFFVQAENYLHCSQVWFPTVQEVLHADWQEVWHSPQPPFFTVFCNFLVFNVCTCFIIFSLLSAIPRVHYSISADRLQLLFLCFRFHLIPAPLLFTRTSASNRASLHIIQSLLCPSHVKKTNKLAICPFILCNFYKYWLFLSKNMLQ